MLGNLFGKKSKKSDDKAQESSAKEVVQEKAKAVEEAKIKVKDDDSCRKVLHIEVPAKDVAEDYANVLKPYLQHGSIPGFRKGKAPRDMIIRQYADHIRQEFQQAAVSKAYRKAIKDQGLSIVAVVNVENVFASPETGLTCDVTVDITPEFKLPKYRGVPVKKQEAVVTDEQVEEQVKRLQERFAEFKDITGEESIADGDAVQVDYVATMDGKPLVEVVADAGSAASANNAWCMAGEKGSVIPGMSEALVGAKPNTTVNVTLTLPKTYPNEKLHEKKVDYAITIKAARKRVLPALDETFFKTLGVESLDVLRTKLREQMEAEAKAREAARRRDEACGYLVKNTKLDLPKSLVAQETRAAVSNIVQSAMRQGMKEDQLKEQQAEVLKTAEQMAQQRLRLSFILARIAEEEKLEALQDEIDQRISRMAKERGTDVAKMKAEIDEKFGLDGLMTDIRCQKAMELVLTESVEG